MLRRRSHSKEYRAHLASPEWARIRRGALERAKHRCSFCGLDRRKLALKGRHLEVHHSSYANLGHEQPEDLTVLCAGAPGSCHTIADRQRRAGAGRRPTRKRRRRRSRRLSRGLREMRTPVTVLVFGVGGLKVASIVLPALS